MCSIIGVGERLHEVLGQIDLGKLDSGERSLPFWLLVLIVNVCPFLFVFDLLFNLFRIALWPSVGKEFSPWLFTCAVFILVPS